jgi:hypothetical protein
MNMLLVAVGVAFWIAVYAFAVVVAVHQDARRTTLPVVLCRAFPYLFTLLFNVVIELRYERGLTNFVLSVAMGFALTWVVVAVARRQWPRAK